MLRALAILCLLATFGFSPGSASTAPVHVSVDARFEDVVVDAAAQGEGLLVGLPNPVMTPPERLAWELQGEQVRVETWTRYYYTVAGITQEDPDRPDERVNVTYGGASASLIASEPNADIAVEPSGPAGMTVAMAAATSRFQVQAGFTYTRDAGESSLLPEDPDPGPATSPRGYRAGGSMPNLQYKTESSTGWIKIEGDFMLTFLAGTMEVHNATGTHQVDARYEIHSSTVSPFVHNEHSITRAFVNVTNGTAFIQPGGRPLQVNLAGYDFPAASNVRLLDARGTVEADGKDVRFHDATLHAVGDGLRVTATPFESGGALLQQGRIEGPIEEVYIDGKRVELQGQTIIAEPDGPPDAWVLFIASTAAVVALAVAWVARRRRRRRRAGPLAEQARDLLDVEDYETAASVAKEAVRCDPRHGEAAAVLAIACIQLGSPGEAVEHLERSRAEDDPLVRLLLSVSLREAGHPRQARRMLESLMEEHPDLWSMISRTDLARLLKGSVGTSEAPAGYG